MKALIILDCQKGMISGKQFDKELSNIKSLLDYIKEKKGIIISTKHINYEPTSIIYFSDKSKSDLESFVESKSDYIIEKSTPNIFIQTDLLEILKKNNVDEVVICGFNAEYCCLFSAIIFNDRGFKVTYIEDATSSVNTPDTYEMPGLDIVDFVGCILDWSGLIEVLYYEEYLSKY